MVNFKKISNRTILLGLAVFNGFIFISFLFQTLNHFNIISNSLSLLALPSQIISMNIMIVILLFVIEAFLIIFCWYRWKNKATSIATNEDSDIEFDLDEVFDNSDFENEIDNEIKQISRNTLVLNYSDVFPGETEKQSNSAIEESFKENSDFTPTSLKPYEETSTSINLEQNQIKISNKLSSQKNKGVLTERQFAIYQNIVNNRWLYERTIDQKRIGLNQYSIDESNINITDIQRLIKIGLVYRKEIQHPTGSFNVLTSDINIEKEIILDILRRTIRKLRAKYVSRKYKFQNWKEFGLKKDMWRFDFEILKPQILGCIWTDNAISICEKNISLTQDKKDELKALIAATCLKMTEGGKPYIITTRNNYESEIKRFAKKMGWGKIFTLNFSNSKFFTKIEKILDT